MSQLSLGQRFRFAVDDIGRALRFVFRPWIDLSAVKTTQIEVVNAVSAGQADIANALASIDALNRKLARLEAQAAEQDVTIRQLLDGMELVRRDLAGASRPGTIDGPPQ